jgi:IclR family transcriptional regulator, KDG regulon repressor
MPEIVNTLDRALDILLCFSREKPLLSLTEISYEVGINKSTVYRLLTTLVAKGFLLIDTDTKKYHLGFRILDIALRVYQDLDQHWVLPYLQSLTAEYGETTNMAILDGDRIFHLQVVESKQHLTLAPEPGPSLPAGRTASGKAILAYLPDDQIINVLNSNFDRYPENSSVLLENLMADIHESRQRGFAISEGEFNKDVNAVAAPILTEDGYPIAAIAIVAPAFRLQWDRMMTLGERIMKLNRRIADEVGLAALPGMVTRIIDQK